MINKELINFIKKQLDISNDELLEKDLLLHLLLVNLYNNKYFKENFVFKGGTCLIKCYLGYYRFSEDLDFTYINQNKFNNISEKRLRKELTSIINLLSKIILDISTKINMMFSNNKSDRLYYEFSSNNKLTTFKIWYKSLITNKNQFIKIQINFVEKIFFNFKTNKITNLFSQINKNEFLFLFPEFSIFYECPLIKTYDIKEILIEKNRAILTRKGIKVRDFIDLFLITKKINQNCVVYEDQIIQKTIFVLKKYQRYVDNLKLRQKYGFDFVIGDENKLLLCSINYVAFNEFKKNQIIFLEKILIKMNS
jgi:predicted nucleotidyltransferase component of viral defense system